MSPLADDVTFSAADLALWRRNSGPRGAESLERTLLTALAASHHDSAMLRVLPVFLANAAGLLDWNSTCEHALSVGLESELGFITELAGMLAGLPDLVARAQRLHRPNGAPRPYFPVRSDRERRLSETRAPPVARKWGFLMNMGEDSFRTAFEKHRAQV